MFFERSLKHKRGLLVTAFMVSAVGIFLFLISPILFQEGNPWPQIKGVAQLSFGKSSIVKISDANSKYMTKSKNGPEAVKMFMKGKGYEFVEQMGSGYLYISRGGTAVAGRKSYSRYYAIWNITENIGQNTVSFADELRECLPKSDAASHEKCTKLLKLINSFDSCVAAGFSILKSKPLQCATPDGRTFVENIN